MNQFSSRRFNQGLSSGLSILAIFAVGYSLNGGIESVIAADGPSTNKTSQAEFKILPAEANKITSKHAPTESISNPTNPTRQTTQAPPAIDTSKGVASEASNDSGSNDLQDFQATAYCLKGRTASGEYVRPGVIAADPRVLPIGTVVHIRAGRYTGTYKVLDTGGRIKGRKIDIYVPAYKEAMSFGRRPIKLKVLSSTKRRPDPARKSIIGADS